MNYKNYKDNELPRRVVKVSLDWDKYLNITKLVKLRLYQDRTKFVKKAVEEKLHRDNDKLRKRVNGKKGSNGA